MLRLLSICLLALHCNAMWHTSPKNSAYQLRVWNTYNSKKYKDHVKHLFTSKDVTICAPYSDNGPFSINVIVGPGNTVRAKDVKKIATEKYKYTFFGVKKNSSSNTYVNADSIEVITAPGSLTNAKHENLKLAKSWMSWDGLIKVPAYYTLPYSEKSWPLEVIVPYCERNGSLYLSKEVTERVFKLRFPFMTSLKIEEDIPFSNEELEAPLGALLEENEDGKVIFKGLGFRVLQEPSNILCQTQRLAKTHYKYPFDLQDDTRFPYQIYIDNFFVLKKIKQEKLRQELVNYSTKHKQRKWCNLF